MGLFNRSKKTVDRERTPESGSPVPTREQTKALAEELYHRGRYSEALSLLTQLTREERLADQGRLEYCLAECYMNEYLITQNKATYALGINCLQNAAAAGNARAQDRLGQNRQPQQRSQTHSDTGVKTTEHLNSSADELPVPPASPTDPAQEGSAVPTPPQAAPVDESSQPAAENADAVADAAPSNLLTLTYENGQTKQFEVLDLIEYQGRSFVVLFDPDSTDGLVIILEVVECVENPELESYITVDEKLMNILFQIFKERNRDVLNFED